MRFNKVYLINWQLSVNTIYLAIAFQFTLQPTETRFTAVKINISTRKQFSSSTAASSLIKPINI